MKIIGTREDLDLEGNSTSLPPVCVGNTWYSGGYTDTLVYFQRIKWIISAKERDSYIADGPYFIAERNEKLDKTLKIAPKVVTN